MNGGKQRHTMAKRSLGYTVIEVMIVLAVSGVMFLIASTFVSGKQGRTAFNEGVTEMASLIQKTIDSVSDGQYTDIQVNCNFDGAATTFPVGARTQGTNSKCVFLGKVMHFTESGAGGTPSQQYETFSLAGGRVTTDNKPIFTVADAKPAVIPKLTAEATIPQRLDVTRIKVNNATVPDSYGIGFFQGLGSKQETGDIASGSQSTSLWYVSGLINNRDSTTAQGTISGGSLTPADRIDICMSDGSRYATITLGVNNNQLGVEVSNHGETNIC